MERTGPGTFLCDDAPSGRLADQFPVSFWVLLDHCFGFATATFRIRDYIICGWSLSFL
jgi:hypothetical protein